MLQACSKVVAYVSGQVDSIRFGLDGKNVDAVFTELGIRFHRVVYEHLLNYQYNSMGQSSTVHVLLFSFCGLYATICC